MGSLSTSMFSAANIGMSMVESKEAATLKRMEAELSADNLEAKALRTELEAEAVLEKGRLDQTEAVVKGRTERAGKLVEYAASGVDVNSGSAVETIADQAAWSEYDRQKIEYGASAESWGLKYDAKLLRRDAHNARAGASSSGGNARLIVNAGQQLTSLIFK